MATADREFICPKCKKPSASPVLATAAAYNDGWDIPSEFAFLQCKRCLHPLVQWRENYGEGFESDEPVFMYPEPKRLSHQIPRGLRNEYTEALKCFDAKAYQATLVMVRRTLEATCVDQGASAKKSLAENLKKLQAAGKIDGMLAEWADMLRVVGNAGAHFDGTVVERADAEDALAFAEALLDHLYVLRQQFKEFKKRRSTAKP